MARYSKIDRRIHTDAGFRALSKPQPCGQALWWTLLTTQRMTAIPGLIQASEVELASSLGWPLEGFRKAFREVFDMAMAKADWEAGLIWLPNARKYNQPESPNVVRSWRIPWDEIPESFLKLEAWQILKDFTEGMGEPFAKAFREACPKPSVKGLANPEPEPEQKPKPVQPYVELELNGHTEITTTPFQQVFDHWKIVHQHPNAVGDEKRQRTIRARLRDGYTVEQLCQAIDGCKNSPHHMGQNDTSTVYDDLSLICRDATHVDKFIKLADQSPHLNGVSAVGKRAISTAERWLAKKQAEGDPSAAK